MVWYLRKKYKLLFPLVLALLLIGLSLIISYFRVSPPGAHHLTGNFQKILYQKERTLNRLLRNVENDLGEEPAGSLFNRIEYFDKFSKKGFTVYVFENDNPVFWSDNGVIPVRDGIQDSLSLIRLTNGWYLSKLVKTSCCDIAGLIKIKNEFPFENNHIKNTFHKDFGLPEDVGISTSGKGNMIFSTGGKYLFSLEFPEYRLLSSATLWQIFILYLSAYILIIYFIYLLYKNINSGFVKGNTGILMFTIDILILRYLMFYFQIPAVLYESKLFSPYYFALSGAIPSLGDLIFNAVTVFSIAIVFHKELVIKLSNKKRSPAVRAVFQILTITLSFILFELLTRLISAIIVNSVISFNLDDITSITIYSIAGFFSMALFTFSFVLFTFKPLYNLSGTFQTVKGFYLFIAGSGIVLFGAMYLYPEKNIIDLLLFLLYAGSFKILAPEGKFDIKASSFIYLLVLFSFYVTLILYESNNIKERETRKKIAFDLGGERDPIVEGLLTELSGNLSQDTTIKQDIYNFLYNGADNFDKIKSYITDKYIDSYLQKYNILITICDNKRVLYIQPEDYETGCFGYFDSKVKDYGTPVNGDKLYYMDYDMTNDNYIGIVDYGNPSDSIKIFIELYSKIIPRGVGYPELLIDQKKFRSYDLSKYSWATYENGVLNTRFGKYFYSTKLSQYGNQTEQIYFFDRNGYNHLFYRINDKKVLIISRRSPGLADIASPFSYIFISFGALLFVILRLFNTPVRIRFFDISFKKRLQLWITAIILVSFFLVGTGSLIYIVSLNNTKNNDILSEKAHSVLIELEHKLSDQSSFTQDTKQYLSDILYKFSLVFFTDINLYDTAGTLIATSRPEIFNKGLVSKKINSRAFNAMFNNRKSFFVHNESIGNYQYLSAYLPFRNYDNELIAFVNLPYFARQDELTNEISTLLVAFINIYVILIAVSIFIALIISNYITKPVQLIKEKISRLDLGKTNEKIKWERNDEIGSLVQEYNRMVDELAKSAELLAKSERETAWREMAKQVAHEIKNPLTPMKLSIQYLNKAKAENAPGWDEKFKRFTETLIEQIDTLSAIATAFSDFAKMPVSNFEKIELAGIIKKAIELFEHSTKVTFRYNPEGKYYVSGNREQLIRVFNNLIKNSIQAIEDEENGIIEISISTEGENHIIVFSDNGKGIAEEEADKVFYPSFTTKTSGMGLGLAMVKNIIENTGGDISFTSEKGTGTTFYIKFPAL